MAPPRKGKKVISVDFTGVTTEGGGRLLPEGQYQLELKEIEQKEGESSGEPYLEFTFEVVNNDDDSLNGTKAWDNLSLQPKALWKLRQFMEAGGHPTEDGPMDVDPDALIGTVVTVDIIHEDYKNKTKHRIGGYVLDNTADTAPSASAPTRKKAAPGDGDDEFKKGQKVSFMDGKKKIPGTVKAIEDGTVTVTVKGVSKEVDGEYEVPAGELTAA